MRQMLMLLTAILFVCCSSEGNEVMAQTMTQKLYITIGGMTKTATMVDNTATQELVARLQQAPVTVTLNSSGGFEIWGHWVSRCPQAMSKSMHSQATSCFTTAATSACSTAQIHGATPAWGILTGCRRTNSGHFSMQARATSA